MVRAVLLCLAISIPMISPARAACNDRICDFRTATKTTFHRMKEHVRHAHTRVKKIAREARFSRAEFSSPGPRPGRWCGWWMRQQVGQDPGPAYNLARNWAHWGQAAAAGIGAIVVWSHHVGMIVGGSTDHWIIKSGNDGHAVRERERSVGRAIAFRRG